MVWQLWSKILTIKTEFAKFLIKRYFNLKKAILKNICVNSESVILWKKNLERFLQNTFVFYGALRWISSNSKNIPIFIAKQPKNTISDKLIS